MNNKFINTLKRYNTTKQNYNTISKLPTNTSIRNNLPRILIAVYYRSAKLFPSNNFNKKPP